MMLKKYLILIVISLIVIGEMGCEKSFDMYRNATPMESVPQNTYQFLKEQNHVFDTLIYLLDKTGLDQILKTGMVTIFAPQDVSIETEMKNLNETRIRYGENADWTIDSVPTPIWDTLLRRYMLSGIVNSDSLGYADGVDLSSMSYGYKINGKRIKTNSSGIEDGGPYKILYSDMKNSRFVADWAQTETQTIDIKTSNGMLHILEDRHLFGFNSFISMAFPQSSIPALEPYSGIPSPIPGTIECVDFDFGGEGIAYHDVDPGNNGGEYRSEGVDITRSNEGGYQVGWTEAGEWLKYTVNVTETGWYRANFRAGSPYYNGFQHYSLSFDGEDVTGIQGVSATGDFPIMNDWNFSYVYLNQGIQVLTLHILSNAFDFKSLTFTKLDEAPPESTPFNGTPMEIPGLIPAADYDNGGQGIAYNDMDNGNTGNDYRNEDVDIHFGPDPVPAVGWTFAGEWMKYTVDVKEAGDYKVKLRYGVPDPCNFRLEFDGVNKSGTVSVPGTGDWGIFQTAEFLVTDLEPGVQVMKFYLIIGNFDLASFEFIKQ